MVFDLRYVPDDVRSALRSEFAYLLARTDNLYTDSFSDRKIRDRAVFGQTANYKPPDFVVKSLQHTVVDCTWDAGERERFLSAAFYIQY